ncbi:hypothetical protein VNI00_017484 [Paramarasmius palmivorus]|uniref:Uncharacterized protein n=1 Tax=Paramarasmius palmivorus TaxID=297713 RepID=A0AAW0B4S4_9AGAR
MNIKDYIGTQYNSVLNNSRDDNDPNVYSGLWTGPPPVGYSIENQTNAISVLLAAIPLRNETVEVSPTGLVSPGQGPSPQPSNNEQNRSLNVGAVSGGAVGGTVFVALLAGMAFLLCCRRKRARSLMALDEDWPEPEEAKDPHLRPYILPIGPKPRPRKEKQSLAIVGPDASSSLPDISNATLVPGPSNVVRAVPNNENESDPSRLGNVPTSELVRALNDRLQPEQWREDEVPPEYASHHG